MRAAGKKCNQEIFKKAFLRIKESFIVHDILLIAQVNVKLLKRGISKNDEILCVIPLAY
jgi:hypothetical protein